jgi:hypothetical protein
MLSPGGARWRWSREPVCDTVASTRDPASFAFPHDGK